MANWIGSLSMVALIPRKRPMATPSLWCGKGKGVELSLENPTWSVHLFLCITAKKVDLLFHTRLAHLPGEGVARSVQMCSGVDVGASVAAFLARGKSRTWRTRRDPESDAEHSSAVGNAYLRTRSTTQAPLQEYGDVSFSPCRTWYTAVARRCQRGHESLGWCKQG